MNLGDADISQVAQLVSDPARGRILMALGDGRALPASTLAAEAGVSLTSASNHLARLLSGGLLEVEPVGRYRYYRLARPEIPALLEALAQVAPMFKVRSLRQGTHAAMLRSARICYDHLAGQLGVAITQGLLDRGALRSVHRHTAIQRRPGDKLSAPARECPFQLGANAARVLEGLGVELERVVSEKSRRPLIRSCVDWSEQKHHLSGRLGAAIASSLIAQGLVTRGPRPRVLRVTADGAAVLHRLLGVPSLR